MVGNGRLLVLEGGWLKLKTIYMFHLQPINAISYSGGDGGSLVVAVYRVSCYHKII